MRSTLKYMMASAALACVMAAPAWAQTDEPATPPTVEESAADTECAAFEPGAVATDAEGDVCVPASDETAAAMAPAQSAMAGEETAEATPPDALAQNAAPVAQSVEGDASWAGDDIANAPAQVQEAVRDGEYTTDDLNRAMLAALRGEASPS